MKQTTYICIGLLLFSLSAQASEAEFKKLTKTYTLHEDGSQEMRVSKELTVHTYAAMRSLYGESFIIYDPACQELKIHESYTRRPDGSTVRTPQNAFAESLPFAAANAPAYSRLREMVVVHTGLEPGATICLDYSVVTRAGALPQLDVCTQVEELSPVKEYVCTVSAPAGSPLHYVLAGGKAVPAVTEADGMRTVTWTLKDVPAYYPSDDCPSLAGNVRMILANTYASAQDALQVLRSQFTAAAEAEVVALSGRLTEGKAVEEKAAALKAYVQDLGTCRLTLGQTGYRLRPASEVIRTAYGTEAEKLNLLCGLMQAAGLAAEPKAAYAVQADTDNLGLSAVTELFLESAAVADRQAYQPVLTLEGKPARLAPSPAISRTDTLDVTPDGGKRLAGGLRVVSLPRTREGIAAHRYGHGGGTRTANLLLPRLVDETYTCIVRLPEGMTLCPKSPVEVSNAVGTLRVTVQPAAGGAAVTRSLKLARQLITPADYPAFRTLLSEWEAEPNGLLLLKE